MIVNSVQLDHSMHINYIPVMTKIYVGRGGVKVFFIAISVIQYM